MLFQRYMTGRGSMGYGFRAQTSESPRAPYMKLRASDTGSTQRLLLEIMTTEYNQLAAIGSCYDREQSNGYTDILFPIPSNAEEQRALWKNPGRLLYLPHVGKEEFFEISKKGKNVLLGDGYQFELPQPTHEWDNRFHLDKNTLADLVADVWYASSIRLTSPENPGDWPIVRIRLTEMSEGELTCDLGREFYCNVLMPALPETLRGIVSVSIGGRLSDVSNAANGGAAAVIISLPDEEDGELTAGSYILTPNALEHNPLDPMHLAERWRAFGKAILHFTNDGIEDAQGTDAYMNDFFAVTRLLLQNDVYAPLRNLTASWLYAYLLFNAHLYADDAYRQTGEFAADIPVEALQQSFKDNVWDSALPDFFADLGISDVAMRSCLVWLEADMIKALLSNERLLITPERYAQLTVRAFTLQNQVNNPILLPRLEAMYDKLLLRGSTAQQDDTASNNAAEMLISFLGDKENRALFSGQESRLTSLLQQALMSSEFEPDTDMFLVLADYARCGEAEKRLVTTYAIEMLTKETSLSKLRVLRPVQNIGELDRAVVSYVQDSETIKRCMDPDFRSALRAYTDTPAADDAMTGQEIKKEYAAAISGYIAENAEVFHDQLDQVRQVFLELGLENSEELMEAYTACIGHADQSLPASDIPYVVCVLSSQQTNCAKRMTDVLQALFESALPRMFEQAGKSASFAHNVVDQCWLDCLSKLMGDSREELRGKLSESLCNFIKREAENLRAQMLDVKQAFNDIGLDSGKSEATMDALCACMQTPDAEFTNTDAQLILPVLKSNAPQADVMAKAVLDAFEERMPDLLDSVDRAGEKPWVSCVKDKQPSDAQRALACGLKDALKRYVDRNATELSMQLIRITELYQSLGDIDNVSGEMLADICCTLLKARLDYVDDAAMLNEQDLQVLGNSVFRNVDDQKIVDLADALQALFCKDLPRMAQYAETRELWRRCLKSRYVGDTLRVRTAETVHRYITENAAEMCSDPNGTMDIYDAFGGNREQRMEGWITLLDAVRESEGNTPILSEQYVNALTKDMLQAANESTIDRMVSVFQSDLDNMLHNEGLQEWATLNRKPSPKVGLWKTKAQQAFCAYVAQQTQLIMDGETETHLDAILAIVRGMDWERADMVRKVVVAYFVALKRESLSADEMQGLVSIRSNANRDVDSGMSDVFLRGLPRMLSACASGDIDEAKRWEDNAASIDLRDVFRKAIQQQCGKATNGEEASAEAQITPLLRFGHAFAGLQAIAAEQAIDIVEARKATLSSAEHLAKRFMSADEHRLMQTSVLECGSALVLRKYIDLLDYEPVVPENPDNEKALNREIASMRASLIPHIHAETAVYINGKGDPWRAELQEAILQQLLKVTTAAPSFSSLCETPVRWESERGDLNFLEFRDLTAYIPDRQQLSATVVDSARKVVANASLTMLMQNSLQCNEGWFDELLYSLVTERVERDSQSLAEECGTPQEARNLQQMIQTVGGMNSASTGAAIDFILNGKKTETVSHTMERLKNLRDDARETAILLLRKAVFGKGKAQWSEQWGCDDQSGKIALAAICYLGGNHKEWQSFFDIVLQGTSMDGKALACGTDPAQAILFASSVLNACKMQDEARDLVDELKQLQPAEYLSMRGMGRKRKELSALRNESTWGEVGASSELYNLLFDKMK